MNSIKKIILIITFLIISMTVLNAQEENIDVIVVIDTSWSVWKYYDDIVNYLIKYLLEELLHQYDTFHLLYFSEQIEHKVSERIDDQSNIQQILNDIVELKLIYPIGKYTDILKSFEGLYEFVSAIPGINKKIIIMISDWIHDPRPGTSVSQSAESIKQDFLRQAGQILREGWSINIIRIPHEMGTEAGTDQGIIVPIEELAQILGITVKTFDELEKKEIAGEATGYPVIEFPNALGTVGREFIADFSIKNFLKEPLFVKLVEIESNGENILNDAYESATIQAEQKINFPVDIKLPEDFPEGPASLEVTLRFANGLRFFREQGTLSFTYSKSVGIPFSRIFDYILPILLILLVIGLGILIFLLIRRRVVTSTFTDYAYEKKEDTQKTIVSTAPAAAPGKKQYKKAKMKVKKIKGEEFLKADDRFSFPVEMIVSDQKRYIGFRNIHRINQDGSRNIGGGYSSFLIFLYPVPPAIAKIDYDGTKFTFHPLKEEFFPEVKNSIVDCLDKEIPCISTKGHDMTITFKKYISPLEELNKLMRSIREDYSE